MIWTVTPNPAVDTTYTIPELRYGKTHRVEDVEVRPGGKGINVARVLLQLGADVGVTGPLGGTTGALIESELERIAPTLLQRWVYTQVTTRTSVAVVDRDATVFNEAGSPVPPAVWEDLAETLRAVVKPGDVVTISGSLPLDTPPGTVTALGRVVREAGAKLIVDTSGPALLEGASIADLVKPNDEELLAATGTQTVSAGVQVLLDLGCPLVVVSRGPDGMELWSEKNIWCCRPEAELVGNATGAGDSAVASWALSLREGLDSDDQRRTALLEAVATSAAAVVVPTAGEVDLALRSELLGTLTVTTAAREPA